MESKSCCLFVDLFSPEERENDPCSVLLCRQRQIFISKSLVRLQIRFWYGVVEGLVGLAVWVGAGHLPPTGPPPLALACTWTPVACWCGRPTLTSTGRNRNGDFDTWLCPQVHTHSSPFTYASPLSVGAAAPNHLLSCEPDCISSEFHFSCCMQSQGLTGLS